MLPSKVSKLVQEVFAILDEQPLSSKNHEQRAKEDPEACLVALLEEIKQRLPEGWETLDTTVASASGNIMMKNREAERRKLRRSSSGKLTTA